MDINKLWVRISGAKEVVGGNGVMSGWVGMNEEGGGFKYLLGMVKVDVGEDRRFAIDDAEGTKLAFRITNGGFIESWCQRKLVVTG